jgi:hypothetical protein
MRFCYRYLRILWEFYEPGSWTNIVTERGSGAEKQERLCTASEWQLADYGKSFPKRNHYMDSKVRDDSCFKAI